jgi:hypothetical protein
MNYSRVLFISAFTLISSGFLFIMSQPFNLPLTSRSKRPSHPADLFSLGPAMLEDNKTNSSISLKFPYGGIGQQID